jgi:hypothetical protein
MIPKGWRVGSLSDIANITMGQSPSGSSYNEDGLGVIFYQGRTDFGNRFPSQRLYTTEPKRTLRTFDPKYESMKVGICSTLMLMNLFHEYTINLGFEMEYKIKYYSPVNDFWEYERKLSPNLVLLNF